MTRHKRSARPVIGIDLGTWKCCVGVVREGKVEIIENERGCKTTPSYVAFTETERLVGDDAKDQVARNPINTIYGVKRIIGRRFDDKSFQTDMMFWPFTVYPDQHGRLRIPVRYRKGEKVLSPELVSAMMLEKMKRIAETHLGCAVIDAVISVPAYFNNSQRQATKDAGAIAGLNVLGLINEPTAAALAYRDNKARVEPHNVLIFDLGGGTFDVAVIRVDESGVKVKGVCGDAEFGGNEMDVLLLKHFDKEFVKKHGKHVLQDKKGLERLRTASETAKKTLTLLPKANVQVDSLIEDIDFNASIKRHDFEQLYYTNVKERIVNVLTNVLKQANIPHSEIEEVILVGGTSRIPKIQSILKEFFVDKSLNKTVNPDEAVAHGAALRAELLAGDIDVVEVYVDDMFQVPPSTEIERMDGKFRNYRAIPMESFHILNCSIKDEDEECNEESEAWVSQKETVMKKHKFNSYGIFEISTWGTANPNETRIPEIGCLAEPEITQLADQIRQFAEDDQELMESVAAMSDLQALCFQTKVVVTSNSLRQKLGPNSVKNIAGYCDEIICWLDDNDSALKTEYQHKKRELFGRIKHFMKRIHVKVDDFHEADKKWFRKISIAESEQSSCGDVTITNKQPLNLSDPLSTQLAPQQEGQYFSAQSSPTLPEQGQCSIAQTTPTPPEQRQSMSAQPTPTLSQQGQFSSTQPSPISSQQRQSYSAQPTQTPPEHGQSSSAQPTSTPPEQRQSSSAQQTPTLPQQGQSSSAQQLPKPLQQGQYSLAQTSPTLPKQGQSSSFQPTPTPPEQGQYRSAQPTPTPPQQSQASSAQPSPAPLEQRQSGSAQPTQTHTEQEQSSSVQPTLTPPKQGQSSSTQTTTAPPVQGQSKSAQPTPTHPQQEQSSSAKPTQTPHQRGQSSLAQPVAALPEQGLSNLCQLETQQGHLKSSKEKTVIDGGVCLSPSVQSVEDPQNKSEDETKHKHAKNLKVLNIHQNRIAAKLM